LNYPILDPAAVSGTTSVQPTGFSINASVVGYTGGNASATNNPAPMPVRRLYQLQDGTLVPGTGTGNTTTVSGATAANPIVGRIAFWADDETCKVNINTAAEGHIGTRQGLISLRLSRKVLLERQPSPIGVMPPSNRHCSSSSAILDIPLRLR
jgi:hypothetical protein